MILKEVLIIGSSGHAKVVIDILERNNYKIVGLIDDFKSIGDKTLDYNVLGKINDVEDILRFNKECSVFVAIGDNFNRKVIVNKILKSTPDVDFVSAIHPSAQIGKNVKIGKGIAIMAGAIVDADAEIGDFALINSNANAGHDIRMMRFSSLAPGVTVGGNVTIGVCSAVSIGATVREKISIGDHSVIGAGATLLIDCPDNSIMYGVPAKFIRHRVEGEKYL